MTGSGISGQTILEGVLMKSSSKYALAVRKPNNDIEVLVERFSDISEKNTFLRFPFIRGIVNFATELYLGIKSFKTLGMFYEKESEDKSTDKNELLQILIVVAVISLAIGIFIALPYGLSIFFARTITSGAMLVLTEGIMRLVLLILYMLLISMLPDIKKFYMYLGASHKTMNCIEKKIPLTISNVRRMSKKSDSCGTVFLFTVLLVSAVLFMFIRVENTMLRIVFRLLIIPVVAAFMYEIRELSSKGSNIVVSLLNLPAILVQAIVTDEPGEDMLEVSIRAAAAINGEKVVIEKETIEPKKTTRKKKEAAKTGIKRVSKKTEDGDTKAVEVSETEQIKEKSLARRAKLAVNNKEDKKIPVSQVAEEDDEILNALNHFFNSKKEEKNRGKKK